MRPERLECLALRLQIRRDVATGGGDAGMPQIVTDHRDIDAGLQECDGTTVS